MVVLKILLRLMKNTLTVKYHQLHSVVLLYKIGIRSPCSKIEINQTLPDFADEITDDGVWHRICSTLVNMLIAFNIGCFVLFTFIYSTRIVSIQLLSIHWLVNNLSKHKKAAQIGKPCNKSCLRNFSPPNVFIFSMTMPLTTVYLAFVMRVNLIESVFRKKCGQLSYFV